MEDGRVPANPILPSAQTTGNAVYGSPPDTLRSLQAPSPLSGFGRTLMIAQPGHAGHGSGHAGQRRFQHAGYIKAERCVRGFLVFRRRSGLASPSWHWLEDPLEGVGLLYVLLVWFFFSFFLSQQPGWAAVALVLLNRAGGSHRITQLARFPLAY
ncbi:hypothetical protein F5Y14DRAFT_399651 [Nemania sp. NC0429]|nr:hypothetical protein F5Y14DRAFT_399651 [Nemania sp. NC0429]